MQTNDLSKPITAAQLNESMHKKFGVRVNLSKYTREELENYRNIIRTRMYQAESSSNFNSLLNDEEYQKDKHMAAVLNQRIKEMLGESIAELKQAIAERKLSPAEKEKKEKVIKKDLKGKKFKGGDEEMYAVATNIAKGKKMNTKRKTNESQMAPHEKCHYHAKMCADAYHNGMLEIAQHHLDEVEKHGGSMKLGKTCTCHHPKLNNGMPFECAGSYSAPMASGPMGEGKMPMKKGPNGKMVPAFAADGKGKNDLTKKKAKTEALDPVGKEDDDINNDGKKDKTDDYLKNRRAAVAKAIGKKKTKESLGESIARFLAEDEEAKAKDITAGVDMVNDFTSWMQRVGQYQTKSMIELADNIRANFGAEESQRFKEQVSQALAASLEALTSSRESISSAVAVLAGTEQPTDAMGMDSASDMGGDFTQPEEEQGPAMDDSMAADASAGGANLTGREMRENVIRENIRRGDRLMKILGSR